LEQLEQNQARTQFVSWSRLALLILRSPPTSRVRQMANDRDHLQLVKQGYIQYKWTQTVWRMQLFRKVLRYGIMQVLPSCMHYHMVYLSISRSCATSVCLPFGIAIWRENVLSALLVACISAVQSSKSCQIAMFVSISTGICIPQVSMSMPNRQICYFQCLEAVYLVGSFVVALNWWKKRLFFRLVGSRI